MLLRKDPVASNDNAQSRPRPRSPLRNDPVPVAVGVAGLDVAVGVGVGVVVDDPQRRVFGDSALPRQSIASCATEGSTVVRFQRDIANDLLLAKCSNDRIGAGRARVQ